MKDMGQGPIGIFLHYQESSSHIWKDFSCNYLILLQCSIYLSAHTNSLFPFFD